jgi:hypothetical protein
MTPHHLWNMLVGTSILDAATGGNPTRVARRAMPQRLQELLALRNQPREKWSDADRAILNSVRDLANVLMSGPLLLNETAEMGIGIGVSKELMVCLAAFSKPIEGVVEINDESASQQNMHDVMLSSLRVL